MSSAKPYLSKGTARMITAVLSARIEAVMTILLRFAIHLAGE